MKVKALVEHFNPFGEKAKKTVGTEYELSDKSAGVLIRRGIVSREDGQMQIHAPRMLADMVV